MQFDESERLALVACHELNTRKVEVFTEAKISEIARRVLLEEIEGIPAALSRLEARGLLRHDASGGGYAFDGEGQAIAKKLGRENDQKGFGDWMTSSEKSPACAEMCRRMHGLDFVQFNMVDAEQFEALLRFLDLKEGDRVVDLGCGIGTQAEYVSDRTGATVLGLDFAPQAIARASERTQAKRSRLSFRQGDLDALDLPKASFDAAMVFDTLYFVEDLGTTVADIAGLLAPGGRLGAFYSEDRRPGDPADRLAADGTRLAKALRDSGLAYEAVDFSANERRIWTEALSAATELEAAFEAEGNRKLWQSRDRESRAILANYESGAAARFLYMCRT
jgi:ubiquinone/menaquinone biosynthesis C-methylase UbiE